MAKYEKKANATIIKWCDEFIEIFQKIPHIYESERYQTVYEVSENENLVCFFFLQ